RDALSSPTGRAADPDLPAAGVGAPHIRQRLWFVAQRVDHATGARWESEGEGAEGETWDEAWVRRSEPGRADGGVGYTPLQRRDGTADSSKSYWRSGPEDAGGLGDSQGQRRDWREDNGDQGRRECPFGQTGPWDDAVWIPCADGKARRIKPGL